MLRRQTSAGEATQCRVAQMNWVTVAILNVADNLLAGKMRNVDLRPPRHPHLAQTPPKVPCSHRRRPMQLILPCNDCNSSPHTNSSSVTLFVVNETSHFMSSPLNFPRIAVMHASCQALAGRHLQDMELAGVSPVRG